MTTVWELVQKLTADYIDPNAEVVVPGEEYDWTTSLTVTATSYGHGPQRVQIEAI